MALPSDLQYFNYHEVVTCKQEICAGVVLLNNGISHLGLLCVHKVQCSLHYSAVTKSEPLCLLCMPEAFVPLRFCFRWRLPIWACYQYSNLSWVTHLISGYYLSIQAGRLRHGLHMHCMVFLYNLELVKLRMDSHLSDASAADCWVVICLRLASITGAGCIPIAGNLGLKKLQFWQL